MAKKVTDLDELLVPAAGGDIIHVTDVSNLTDSPEGTSVFQTVATLLRGKVFGKDVNNPGTPAKTLILNMSNSANHPGTQGLLGDFVIHMDVAGNKAIFGVAIATVTSFPADLNDNTKFAKFYEGNKLL